MTLLIAHVEGVVKIRQVKCTLYTSAVVILRFVVNLITYHLCAL